jgi:hypothetical protein
VFGKENFTKNIKGKVTVIVNKCESTVAAIRARFEPSEATGGPFRSAASDPCRASAGGIDSVGLATEGIAGKRL